jgi:hypothetical protein
LRRRAGLGFELVLARAGFIAEHHLGELEPGHAAIYAQHQQGLVFLGQLLAQLLETAGGAPRELVRPGPHAAAPVETWQGAPELLAPLLEHLARGVGVAHVAEQEAEQLGAVGLDRERHCALVVLGIERGSDLRFGCFAFVGHLATPARPWLHRSWGVPEIVKKNRRKNLPRGGIATNRTHVKTK